MNTNALPTVHLDLLDHLEPPSGGILSRTVFQDDHVKLVLFAFDTDQELSEHTASSAAMIHVLSGRATIQLGQERLEAGAHTWIHMPPRLTHAVHALEPTRMALYLLRQDKTV
jgi:quercetin dioxygenase-like cupin family protein